MAHQQYMSCIDACDRCAMECDHCATACLQEQDVAKLARCIALDINCADICRTASAFMARGGELATAICGTCADVCEACAEECAKHPMEHCRRCADACRRCADECRKMAGVGSGQPSAAASARP